MSEVNEVSTKIARSNMLVLFLGIFTSSFNIIPALMVPLIVVFFLLIASILFKIQAIDIRIYKDFRFWFILFTIYCIALAAILGVDITSLQLYRREFKFIIHFGYLILFSSLYFPKNREQHLKYLLVLISILSFLWLVFGILNPHFYNKTLYPYSGYMWETTDKRGLIYLGPFMTHSAAGGFYGVLTMIQFGSLIMENNVKRKFALAIGTLLSTICLSYTDSRAFLVSTFVVLVVILVVLFIIRIFRHNIKFDIVKALVLIFIVFIIRDKLSEIISTHEKIIKDKILETHTDWQVQPEITSTHEKIIKDKILETHTDWQVQTRLKLWKLALKDFFRSPIIGVGPSRFDDNMEVIKTIPEDTRKLHGISLFISEQTTYLNIPLFKVNISSFAFHTDQHAHNVYLNTLAEGGIILFSLFIIMYSKLVWRLWKKLIEEGSTEKSLVLGTLCAIACVSIASLFGNNLFSIIPMVTIACVSSYLLSQKT